MKTEASLARHMDITTGYNTKLKSLAALRSARAKSLFDSVQEGALPLESKGRSPLYNTKEIEVRVLKHNPRGGFNIRRILTIIIPEGLICTTNQSFTS